VGGFFVENAAARWFRRRGRARTATLRDLGSPPPRPGALSERAGWRFRAAPARRRVAGHITGRLGAGDRYRTDCWLRLPPVLLLSGVYLSGDSLVSGHYPKRKLQRRIRSWISVNSGDRGWHARSARSARNTRKYDTVPDGCPQGNRARSRKRYRRVGFVIKRLGYVVGWFGDLVGGLFVVAGVANYFHCMIGWLALSQATCVFMILWSLPS
jgi:hypothetical protein